jgi:membrane protease YdiL (CAAX protease family)
MKQHPLIAYFAILVLLSSAVIAGAKLLGRQGAYLAQAYMLTPALAAIVTRFFFYEHAFRDARLRFGRARDYVRCWLASIGITVVSYLFFTALGSISWDFTGDVFLEKLAKQFAEAGQDKEGSLPPGLTPKMMLVLFFVGGLTVFNIVPGIITGFGEEFGHRGFMFPMLARCGPLAALGGGGLIWFAWHLPLGLVVPQQTQATALQMALGALVLAVGSVCAFTYLAWVFTKSGSIWVAAVAHITLNNAAASFSYFAVIENQLLANLGLTLTMLLALAPSACRSSMTSAVRCDSR